MLLFPFVVTAVIPLAVSAGWPPTPSLVWALLITCSLVTIALLLWLKRKLPAVHVNVKSAELVHHLDMYSVDLDKDEEIKKSQRKQQYLDLVENYYNLTTDIFHIVWGPHYSMGILFPYQGGWQTYPMCQQMYQCYLGLSLGADDTMTIADFGCGTGGPTRCIAQFTGAKIKAVNITEYHLQQMKEWNQQAGLSERIEVIHSDYHHTPIASNSLDGVYMCESLAHSPDYNMLCKEVFRVLKPGAKFTGFNWELTEKFDENNPEHCKIRAMIEQGVGVPQLVKMSVLTEAMKQAGFKVLVQRDHSDFCEALGGKPWWYLLEGNSLSLEVVFSSMTTLLFGCIYILEKSGMVSPGTADAYQTLMVSLKVGLQEGARLGIFTPMHYWLAQKPPTNDL